MSNKIYWSSDTEAAIIEYNAETDNEVRNKIYEEKLHIPISKLVECISNRFHQDYLSDPSERIQQDCLSLVVSKLHMFKPEIGKGKSFGYFSFVVKNYLIYKNNFTYNYYKKTDSIDDVANKEGDTTTFDIPVEDVYYTTKEFQEFIDLIFERFTDEQLFNIFNISCPNHELMIEIAKEYLNCFKEYPDSLLKEKYVINSNKLIAKHISIKLKLTKEKARDLLRAVQKKINPIIKSFYSNYLEMGNIGSIDIKKDEPIIIKHRRISWVDGKKKIIEWSGPSVTEQIIKTNIIAEISNKRKHFTEQKIIDIRKRYIEENTNIRKLAREYNTVRSVIRRIIKCQSYKKTIVNGYGEQEIKDRSIKNKKKNFNAKLSEADVMEIVNKSSVETYKTIANEYGVNEASISNIINGHTWSNITGIVCPPRLEKTETINVINID